MIILEYPIEITDIQTVYMPYDAMILSVQAQQLKVNMWALVDPSKKLAPKLIRLYGTGLPVAEPCGRFISTIRINSFVWHVFDATYSYPNWINESL